MNNLTIRLETEKDYRAVENLTRESFWNVYKPGCDEHYFVHCMRSHKDFIPELAFVLEKDGELIGNIMYTKSWLEDEEGKIKEIVSFGPVCVLPKYQRTGCSRFLIESSFEKVKEMGYEVVTNFGNPANYVGRGFVSCKKKNVTFMGGFPTALLVCELVPGCLEGHTWKFIPNDADACCEDKEGVAAFDATFPPKEKAWRPSQEEFYIYSHSSVIY
ncbi:MAG: N-acetyltransferase [Clostridiales bacterium]|nr:N-acetyltransferase [Clostridiales bacterium]